MAYEFHYTPTGTGVISGKEVLEQTEDAINDLGNTAISGVQEALDKAEQALTNSENAVDDAQTALNTANNAEGVAIQAQNDVSNLSGTVTNIGNRVTTAEGNIGNLQGRMTTAEGNITNLQGRMTTSEGNIGNLQTAVSTAQATANSAQQTATTARQQSYVFRYSSTALTASSTNSNTLLDNTDNLKVGDKVIDSSGVLFSITAIDTQNSTFTIGTALIDLAQDSNVVHKSGDETVGGKKTFDSNTYVYNSDNTATTPNLYLRSSKIEISSQGNTSGDQNLVFLDKNNTDYAYVKGGIQSNGSVVKIRSSAKDSSDNRVVNELQLLAYTNGNKAIFPTYSNETDLGVSNYKWKSVFATNYYYGNDNVEFSTKFVTTDTNQTISGAKTFSDNITCSSNSGAKSIICKTPLSTYDSTNTVGDNTKIRFLDKNNNSISYIMQRKLTNGSTDLSLNISNTDSNNQPIEAMLTFILDSANDPRLSPGIDNTISLGRPTFKFKNANIYLINGLEPSSLSLPSGNASDAIDISSYLVNLDGTANTYTAPANGWISITMSGCTGIQAYITGLWGHQVIRPTVGGVRFFMPILKNQTASIFVFGGTIESARFIPCQGNV